MAGLAQPAAFEALCQRAKKIKWVVFVKRPFGRPEQVLKYLARYTHRVAISNRRLLSMDNGRVSFEYKDYADGNQNKVMTLEAGSAIPRWRMASSTGWFTTHTELSIQRQPLEVKEELRPNVYFSTKLPG
jgi:hypothetical protein